MFNPTDTPRIGEYITAVVCLLISKAAFLDKYCPGNRPDTVTSHYNSITVVFRRPINFSGTGFLISYIAITPGETITGKFKAMFQQ